MEAKTTPKVSRTPWRGDEKTGIIASMPEVKQHPAYDAAKSGDPLAAIDLATNFVTPEWLAKNRDRITTSNPVIVGVHAVEGVSVNMIAQGLAVTLSGRLGLRRDTEIIQTTRAGHTGASGWKRLAPRVARIVRRGGNRWRGLLDRG